MPNADFTVDTHLFRELGELLVGRDSTALVELIKNAYDADATEVVVHGSNLDHPGTGQITITDTGIGMTPEQFRQGFLRIASRLKDGAMRRSPRFGRRYTGAKGIGRLAAHKLARFVHVQSVPDLRITGQPSDAVDATIDWDAVEACETLDELKETNAVWIDARPYPRKRACGTTIELLKLRRRWTAAERARFFAEVETFSPPEHLIALPKSVLSERLLFSKAQLADANPSDPGFTVKLAGDLESGEGYWVTLGQAAQWVIEIEADKSTGKVRYGVTPTKAGKHAFPDARVQTAEMEHPDPKTGPFFQARILIREGTTGSRDERAWLGRSSGIRIYVEGFRVLPYGEPGDDWLSIDRDYTQRQRTLPYLANLGFAGEPSDEDEGLLNLRNSNYFGAVFLTVAGAPQLRMLVNREGFVPDVSFEALVRLIRIGVDYSTRARALAKRSTRDARSEERKQHTIDTEGGKESSFQETLSQSVGRARDLATKARERAAAGDFKAAEAHINQAAAEFEESGRATQSIMTEPAMLRILASVGIQMAAFVHEINGLLGSSIAIEQAIERLRNELDLPREARQQLAQLHQAIGDLRRSVERQAAYLTDVVSPDARRRRSRQRLADRFDAGTRIIELQAVRREITITNEIPAGLKSPPMFPAELTLVFSNLLTNAVKAAGDKGKIHASGAANDDEGAVLLVQNTGAAVDLSDAERWFRPFESTTLESDPVLGQGMGMGLPITRNILEQYGARIEFVRPRRGYASAIEIRFQA